MDMNALPQEHGHTFHEKSETLFSVVTHVSLL